VCGGAEHRGRVAPRLGGTEGGDQQQRRAGQRVGRELEQAQRRQVGGVQVVEHQQQRRGAPGARQAGAGGVEQMEAGRLRFDPRGGAAELGQQLGELRQIIVNNTLPLRVAAPLAQFTQDLHPRPIRRPPLGLPAASPQRGDAVGFGTRRDLIRQARLADARLADDQVQPAAPGGHAAQRDAELFQLPFAADEDSTAGARHDLRVPQAMP
jgi:signal transduction histidine kinase